ncbi:Disease resistance protein RFL1 [Acorus calamus]|uniref:Disease resistance protein RFL1 n=1 Tax=Acorus calamus TaxID=4465 RepID=A0AAV9D0X3_ACOCL|nr:Disease resistance protein RFL1 [Acorus calamus]
MEVVSPVTEVVKCVYNPAVRYVGYAKNLKKNLENLDKAATDLYDRRDEIQQLIRNNAGVGKIPSPRCETWLKRVEDIEKQMVEMKEKCEQEKKCFKGFCPNVYSRMMSGKHVVVTIAEVSELVNTFKSDEGVLVDAPMRSAEMVSAPRVEVDSSTTRTVQKILELIRDGYKQRIGVWGVGGVGKTTVMKMVNNLSEISQMFAAVIWVTVSRDWSIRKSLEVLAVTGIRYLPIEIRELGRLRHLRVSFSPDRDDDTEHEVRRMIPDEGISRLTHLEDLRIEIDMKDERWNEIVEAVIDEIGGLKELCSLDFCFASVEHLERFINISLPWKSGLLKSFRFKSLIGGGWKLPNLEDLLIEESSNMLNIWECNSSLTPPLLGNLRQLMVQSCDKLKYVFPRGVLPYLPNLERVHVSYCEDVEQIIVGEVTNNTLEKLKAITLYKLGKLDCICEGVISCPSLGRVHIEVCGKLRRLPFGTDSAPSLKTIYCEKEWWDSLEWEDDATRNRFQSLTQFQSLTGLQ